MAWRAGAKLFRDIWPFIEAQVEPDEFRQVFVELILDQFLDCDVDPTDLQGVHPEVDAALEKLAQFDEFDDENE
jgi:hypothetical protein